MNAYPKLSLYQFVFLFILSTSQLLADSSSSSILGRGWFTGFAAQAEILAEVQAHRVYSLGQEIEKALPDAKIISRPEISYYLSLDALQDREQLTKNIKSHFKQLDAQVKRRILTYRNYPLWLLKIKLSQRYGRVLNIIDDNSELGDYDFFDHRELQKLTLDIIVLKQIITLSKKRHLSLGTMSYAALVGGVGTVIAIDAIPSEQALTLAYIGGAAAVGMSQVGLCSLAFTRINGGREEKILALRNNPNVPAYLRSLHQSSWLISRSGGESNILAERLEGMKDFEHLFGT